MEKIMKNGQMAKIYRQTFEAYFLWPTLYVTA